MRLIDADALKKLRHDYIQGRIKFDGNEYDLIDKCPTINAVEVVRCSECILFGTYERTGNGYCKHYNGLMNPKPTDFCSHGKWRRE